MQTIILAALTVLCGGGALYLWMLLGKAQDGVQKAHERAQKRKLKPPNTRIARKHCGVSWKRRAM